MTKLPYITIPQLDSKIYTDYFLNTFIHKHGPLESIHTVPNKMYMIDFINDSKFNLDPIIRLLEDTLVKEFNFPKIYYLMLFHHTFSQRIHVDGSETVRHASLNLPLSGFNSTNITWYDLTSPLNDYRINNKEYDLIDFPKSDLTPVATLLGSNYWSLVHTSKPHHVVSENYNNPRLTLCVRFKGNPSFEFLYGLISKYG